MKTLLAAVTLAVLSASAAHATTIDWCAVVLKPPPEVRRDKEYNPDGWLALRQKPDRQSKMLTTLAQGDFLIANDVPPLATGWTHISGVWRIDRGSHVSGYVRSKYIQEFGCPEEQQQIITEVPKPTWPKWLYKK
jgi:hypothetical protein